jgi:hypothetical protein
MVLYLRPMDRFIRARTVGPSIGPARHLHLVVHVLPEGRKRPPTPVPTIFVVILLLFLPIVILLLLWQGSAILALLPTLALLLLLLALLLAPPARLALPLSPPLIFPFSPSPSCCRCRPSALLGQEVELEEALVALLALHPRPPGAQLHGRVVCVCEWVGDHFSVSHLFAHANRPPPHPHPQPMTDRSPHLPRDAHPVPGPERLHQVPQPV